MNVLILKYIIPALAFLGALVAILFSAFNAGKSKEKFKATEKEKQQIKETAKAEVVEARQLAKVQVETIKGANDVKAKINSLEPNAAADKLRDDWTRD